MSNAPIVYRTHHRIRFSELDPYNHVNTGHYATYFVDHRVEGLARSLGWDLGSPDKLGFMLWVRRLDIEFVRPARAGQDVTITSFVRAFTGTDALVDAMMIDPTGKTLANCAMTVAYIDRATQRPATWPPAVQALFFDAADAA